MDILLDTQVLLRWLGDDPRLADLRVVREAPGVTVTIHDRPENTLEPSPVDVRAPVSVERRPSRQPRGRTLATRSSQSPGR